MKKRLLLVLLLIFTCFITTNVYALPDDSFDGIIVMEDEEWDVPTGASAYPNYHTHKFSLEIGTDKYEAYCIRPGKGAKRRNEVTCSPLDPVNYGMTYAAAKSPRLTLESIKTKDIIYRQLGIMDRASAYYLETTGGSETGLNTSLYNFFVVQWHHHLVYPMGDIGYDVDASWAGWVSSSPDFEYALNFARDNFYEYWVGRPNHKFVETDLSGDYSAINDAGGSNIGKYFQYSVHDQGTNTKRYTFIVRPEVSAGGWNGIGTATGVNVVASNGLNYNIVKKWDGHQIVVDVTSNGDGSACDGTLTITGDINSTKLQDAEKNKKVYLCTMKTPGTSVQQYIAFAPGKQGDKFKVTAKCNDCVEQTSSDSHDSNNENTCDDVVFTDFYQVSEINNCCLEGRTSKLEEYKLDELFCSGANSKIKATFWTNKCYNKGFHDEVIWQELQKTISIEAESETVAKYCQVRCTERMEVTVPEAILSATGKFFKLKEQNSKNGPTTGPIIDGTKRCTIKIDYYKARKNYETNIDGEVSAWNSYQKNKAGEDVTAYTTSPQSVDTAAKTFKVKKEWKTCTIKETKTVAPGGKTTTYSKDENGQCSGGTEETCDASSTSNCKFESYKNEDHVDYKYPVRAACTQTYNIYTLTGTAAGTYTSGSSYCIDYYSVKVDDNFPFNKKVYSGLTIVQNGTGKAGTICHPIKTRSDSTGDCESKISAAKNYYSGYSCVDCDSSYNKYNGNDGSITSKDTPTIHSKYVKDAGDDSSSFTSYKSKATTIENITYGCENFLAGVKNGEDVGHNDKFYALKPTATFHYLQIYLEGTDKKSQMKGSLPYTANCNIEFHEGDDTDTNTKTIDSDLFKSGTEVMLDLGDLARLTDGSKIPLDDRAQKSWDKHVRTNAYYEGYCTFDPPANHDGEVTIYPGPKFKELSSATGYIQNGQTGHKMQYAVYLTAFSGQYETWWELTGLGGSNKTVKKFTEAFNEDRTCAEKGYAHSVGDAEDARSSTTAPFTCSLELLDGGMRIGFCNPEVDRTTNQDTCKKDVQGVYQFRVVDPANIFPNDELWKNRADNWRTGKNGSWRPVKSQIESTASKAYSPENLTYSFRINQKAIKAIKDYNKSQESSGKTYADAPLSCKSNNNSVDTGNCGTINADPTCKLSGKFTYANAYCTSDFVSKLAGGSVNGTNLNYNPWKGNKTLTTLRSDGSPVHWAK